MSNSGIHPARHTPSAYFFLSTMCRPLPKPYTFFPAFLVPLPLQSFPLPVPSSHPHSLSPLKPSPPTLLRLQTSSPPDLPSLNNPPRLSNPPNPPQSKRPSAPPHLTATGDDLESTPFQRFLVASFAITSTLLLLKLLASCHTPLESLSIIPPILFSYLFTDFAVGVYHHAVDNYGSANTPIFGYQIAAFQGHHQFPWTITNRDLANNLYRLAIPTLPQLLLLLVLAPSNGCTAFYGSFLTFVVASQEAHRQAHMTRSAGWVRRLQKWGMIVEQGMHARHHRGAHEGNYCILSGVCNGWLDGAKVFRRWEATVWRVTGVEPLCWEAEPRLKDEAMAFLPSSWREKCDSSAWRSR